MTFSEKLKEARKNAGLSQEQLAEKLCVSRQAITKWETGRGLPDVDNLKAVSSLLNVSIDYLLGEENESSLNEIKEKVDLEAYLLSNGARNKKDACVAEKFSDADHIYALIPRKKMNAKEWIADFIVGPGSFDVFDSISNLDKAFYLAEVKGKQFFITIDKEFITSSAVASPYNGKSFRRGDYIYKKVYDIRQHRTKPT